MANRYLGVDPILTNVAIAYKNGAYIADDVFPTLKVDKQSGKHFIYDRGQFRVEDTRRGAGANSKEVTHKVTNGLPYFCEDHSLREFVTDEDVANNIQTGNDPFMDATENVTSLLDVAREKELADMLTSSSNLTNYVALTGGDKFDDYGNSKPFNVIETGMQTVHSNIFMRPNTMIMGRQVWDKWKFHPALLERYKYTSDTPITLTQMSSLFGVERILIGDSGYNSAAEGQTDSMSYIWGKHIILAYIDPKPKAKVMTLGYKYQWQTREVKRLRGVDEEDRKGTFVRVGNDYYDLAIVAAAAGYLIKDVVS